MQHHLEVLRRRWDTGDDVVVERHQPDAVALFGAKVGQTRCQISTVVQLRDPLASEAHRPRDVEENGEVRIRVCLELLDVQAIGASEHAPIHKANVVAWHVASVLGEVDGHPEIGCLVQAVDKAINDRAGQKLEAADPRERLGVDKPSAGRALRSVHGYIFEAGTGTASRSWLTIWSFVIPSDSAWKLSSTRCRNTGFASARISSKLTW